MTKKQLLELIAKKEDVITKVNFDLVQRSIEVQDALAKIFVTEFDINRKSYAELNRVIKLMGDVYEAKNKSVIDTFLSGIESITVAATNFYAVIADKPIKYFEDTITALLKVVGINGDYESLITSGYAETVITSTTPLNNIKILALQSMARKLPRKEFMSKMLLAIQGDATHDGIIQQHYTATELVMFYSQYERQYALNIAEDLGLTKARFSGPTLKTSRQFCKDRKGKIFTKEQIQSWSKLDWGGKNPNYNPFTDIGGYNCVDMLDWVSDAAAKYFEDNK